MRIFTYVCIIPDYQKTVIISTAQSTTVWQVKNINLIYRMLYRKTTATSNNLLGLTNLENMQNYVYNKHFSGNLLMELSQKWQLLILLLYTWGY